jgi:hypothetical protein
MTTKRDVVSVVLGLSQHAWIKRRKNLVRAVMFLKNIESHRGPGLEYGRVLMEVVEYSRTAA